MATISLLTTVQMNSKLHAVPGTSSLRTSSIKTDRWARGNVIASFKVERRTVPTVGVERFAITGSFDIAEETLAAHL